MAKSLELRLNSVEDAKALVVNSKQVVAAAKATDCTSINMLVEATVEKDIYPIVTGIFGPFKAFYAKIGAQEGDIFYPLPHFKAPPVKEVPAGKVLKTLPVKKVSTPPASKV